jgi:hypothetical protein
LVGKMQRREKERKEEKKRRKNPQPPRAGEEMLLRFYPIVEPMINIIPFRPFFSSEHHQCL